MSFHFTILEAKEALAKEQGKFFTELFAHGSMRLEYFSPFQMDMQTPHVQDEIYVIASGAALFHRNNEEVRCNAGDVLFVPAGMEHRFTNFTDNFATWVIFYCKAGGEANV